MPKITRQLIAWMGLSFGLGFGLALVAEDLILQRHNEQLHFIAPKAHFVAGRTLERLRDGVAVPIDFNLTLSVGAKQNIVERQMERFVISYDLWEESYRVVRLGQRKSASNLSAAQLETWCFDNLGLPLDRIPKDQPLFFRVEIRTAEVVPAKTVFMGVDAFSDPMKALIAVFSNPPTRQQAHWMYENGPFSLGDLNKGM